ncbi:arylesterase [Polynucleobacter necessarius]|uniref:arylesterase n=1 Tax=Polynucleobacter necessarius TaxID=576610 RepID=UPI000E08F1E0|nr:arylesterase [Polynucleobacter necessarius]
MNQTNWLAYLNAKRLIGLFCLLFSFVSPVHANSVILVMGDSLSAEYGLQRGSGWVKLLESQLQKQSSPWTVFNASISGETSAGGLTRLPTLLESKKPGIVLLELGAKVLLFGMQIPPNYGQQYTTQFREMYANLAKQDNIRLLPFFLAGVATNKALFQADNIHPNEAAQSVLFKNVWGAMAPYQQMLK